MESKVRKLCVTQSLTLGVKGLKPNSISRWDICSIKSTHWSEKNRRVVGYHTEITWFMQLITRAFNPFTPDRSKSKLDKFTKIINLVKLKNTQHHSKVLLNSFPMNGHTSGVGTWNQKLENFASPKV